MATHTTWSAPTAVQTLMTTELNSLATATLVVSSTTSGNQASGVYDNTAALDLYADFQLGLEYGGAAPAAGTKVAELYLLPTVDGTNYATTDASNQPQMATLVATFESRAGSTSAFEYLVAMGIPLPPQKCKWVVKNTSGHALAASGNTLKMQPYQLQNA